MKRKSQEGRGDESIECSAPVDRQRTEVRLRADETRERVERIHDDRQMHSYSRGPPGMSASDRRIA